MVLSYACTLEEFYSTASDMRELPELVAQAKAHDALLQEDAQNGRQVAESLSVSATVKETIEVLQELFGYQKALQSLQ